MTDDLTVRRAICEAHGLDWPAAKFLTGDTVPELEASAARLADLLGKQRPPDRPTRPPTLFDIAAANKGDRKRTLMNALCGRFPQPRDQQGRYTRPAADFSRGARQPAPTRRSPEVEHNETLLDSIRSGDSDVGASL